MNEATTARTSAEVPRFDGFFQALERRRGALGDVGPRVKELTRRSDARAVLGIAADWAIVAGAVAAAEWLATWWGAVLAGLVIATRINALHLDWFHEALHANLFTRKGWHERLDFLYGLPVFTDVASARETHLKHHRDYVAESQTPTYGYDYWGVVPADRGDRRRLVWLWWVRPLTGYHTWRFVRDTAADLWDHPRCLARCLVFWGAVVGAFAWLGAAHLLLYWFVPLLVVHPVLYFWQDMAQHFNVRQSPTRDVRGLLYRLVFNPHGRGTYHNLHHLHAGIPWYNLRRASELLIGDAPVDVARGFLDLSRQVTTADEEQG